MKTRPEEDLRVLSRKLETLELEHGKVRSEINERMQDLVDDQDKVGILYACIFLSVEDKKSLFTMMMNNHPNQFLFVLAFCDPDSDLYKKAMNNGIKSDYYDYDQFKLLKDVDREEDDVLYDLLGAYGELEECHMFVYNRLESGKTWYKSYQRVIPYLANKSNQNTVE